jgi:Ca2+-binding EF-hand superfamily protein
MGEPFRGDDPSTAWFRGADADGDGKLTQAEFDKDAMRFFAVLDRGHDGEIDPDDIDYYETVLAPEIRTGGGGPIGGGKRSGGGGGGGGGHHRGGGGGGMGGGMGGGGGGMGGGGGGMGGGPPGGGGGEGPSEGGASPSRAPTAERRGAARYGYLDLPEPVTAADTSLNRGVNADEFERAARKRFVALDRNQDGVLDARELPKMSGPSFGGGLRGPGPGGPGAPGRNGITPNDPMERPGKVGAD